MISPSQFYCLKRPMLGKPFIYVLLRIETGLLVWVQEVLNLFINLVPLIGNDFLVLVSLFHHGCQKVRSFFQETHFLHIFQLLEPIHISYSRELLNISQIPAYL
ncbi:hypothetical protein AX758_06755 [Enterococcus mundtii]|nr:hypothetical protein AX758_06755 [Enterococcus mundtii]